MPATKPPLGKELCNNGKEGKQKWGGGVSAAAVAAVDAVSGELQEQEQDDRRPRKRAVVRAPRKQKVGCGGNAHNNVCICPGTEV